MYPSSELVKKIKQADYQLAPPTDKWKAASDECTGQAICGWERTKACCDKQVDAEQGGIQDCMDECGAYNTKDWGAPFNTIVGKDATEFFRMRFHVAPELPEFTGDFASLNDRITYGYKACCRTSPDIKLK